MEDPSIVSTQTDAGLRLAEKDVFVHFRSGLRSQDRQEECGSGGCVCVLGNVAEGKVQLSRLMVCLHDIEERCRQIASGDQGYLGHVLRASRVQQRQLGSYGR